VRSLTVFLLLSIIGLSGCVTYSDVTNDDNARERQVDARVGCLDIKVPECPQPMEGEEPESFALRLAAWREVGGKLAEALATLKLPESMSGITIQDIWAWKDQRGTGGAETRAKGEAAADAAIGLGGSNVQKEGGSDQTETSGDETRTENVDQSGKGDEDPPGGAEGG